MGTTKITNKFRDLVEKSLYDKVSEEIQKLKTKRDRNKEVDEVLRKLISDKRNKLNLGHEAKWFEKKYDLRYKNDKQSYNINK